MRINRFYSCPKCIFLFFAPESGKVFSSLTRKRCVPRGRKSKEEQKLGIVRTELNHNQSFYEIGQLRKKNRSVYSYKPFLFLVSKFKKKSGKNTKSIFHIILPQLKVSVTSNSKLNSDTLRFLAKSDGAGRSELQHSF